jgi:hypothetical protein
VSARKRLRVGPPRPDAPSPDEIAWLEALHARVGRRRHRRRVRVEPLADPFLFAKRC